MKIEYSQLLLNENAYFYKLKRKLSKTDIEIIFQECLDGKKSSKKIFESKVKEPYIHGSAELGKISLMVFEYKKRPSFLKKGAGNIFETKYGIFLIAEIRDLLAVIKKNVSGTKTFNSVVEKIDYNVLTHFLLTEKSKYEKIVSSNMNTASNSVQRKIAEADDLQGILSRFGASKQIINSLRVDNAGNKSTVTINTSRVNSFNIQAEFVETIVWMESMVKLIQLAFKGSHQKSNFINSFAIPIDFKSKIKELEPAYLLIRLGSLKDDIENGLIKKCYRLETNEKVDFQKTILGKECLFKLESEDGILFKNGPYKVRVRKELITLLVDDFKDIILEFDDDYKVALNRYINERDLFIVVFDRFDFVYTHRKIFQDGRLLGDTTNFLNAFLPYKELQHIESEKGSSFKNSSTNFDSNCLFGFVERVLANDASYLICDDLGVEWGDFISAKDDEISFFHAKHHKDGLSASNLEEVFGQVQKNFGFLQLTEGMIEERRIRWQSSYRLNKVQTSIKRIRKAPNGRGSVDDIKKYVIQVSSNPNITRSIFVVINFISKSELEKAIELIKKGKTFSGQGVHLQILWFVNALLANALELGAQFRIVCRP